MPTASVKPYVPDSRRRSRFHIDAWLPIVVVAAFAVIAVLSPRIQPGPFISRVTVANNTAYSFDVEVAGANSNEWTLLEVAPDHATTSVASVFDQGSTWTIRFSVEGRVMGQTVQSRSDLAAAGWRIVVPQAYADTLRSQGVLPTA